jgi:hypothetical protein
VTRRTLLALLAALALSLPAVAADKVTPPANLNALPRADTRAILGRWQYPKGDQPILTFEFMATALTVRIVNAEGKVSNGTADAEYRQGASDVIWLVTTNAHSTAQPIQAAVGVTRLHLVSNDELDMVDAGQDFDTMRVIPLSRQR